MSSQQRDVSSAVIERVQAMVPALLSYFLRRVAHREDAADLLGDTLLALWRRIDDLPDADDEARMWMYGVAAHVLRNARRALRRRSALADRLRSDLAVVSRIQDEGAIDVRLDVSSALAELSARDQELVRLIHWDALTPTEAARVLGINPSTARTRYARARARLAERLGVESAARVDVTGVPASTTADLHT